MDDLIKRQDAIGKIKDWMKFIGYSHSERNVMECTIQMLEELPSAESCENHTKITRSSRDLIDRQDVIDAIYKESKYANSEVADEYADMFVYAIKTLPSAQKTGKWITKSDTNPYYTTWWYECSECGQYQPRDGYGQEVLSDYCPSCGCRMEREDE